MKVEMNQQLDNLTTPTTKLTEEKLNQLANLINKNNNNAKYFASRIRQLLSSKKSPNVQYNILDIIEFTTIHSGRALHNEYNNQQFL